MAPKTRLHFCRFGKPLQRIGASGLQHPVARDGIALRQHQRLVHQCAEMIERRPWIDTLVARDVLGRLQGEAAREYAEAPEHCLLVDREQRVAPFQRRAQRLMATEDYARTAGQQVEAFMQARAQSFDAEQREPCGRELDREWDAIQAPTDLDHRR